MNGQNIIDLFRTTIDHQDDLSDSEVLALANTAYRKMLDYKDWLFLVKTASGTLLTSSREVDLPSDFARLVFNSNDGQLDKVLFVGSNYEPYTLLPQASKRQYKDTRSYFYVDYRQMKIILTGDEDTARSYEYDYIYNPDDLTTSTEPVFPEKYHKYIANGMAYLWNAIDGTDKSFSYRAENEQEFNRGLDLMAYEDAKRQII